MIANFAYMLVYRAGAVVPSSLVLVEFLLLGQ